MDDHQPSSLNHLMKNPGKALLLAFLLGGLGLFYVSIPVGCVIFAVDVLIYVLGVSSGGFGFILLIPWRLVAMLYAMTAVVKFNRRVLDRAIDRERE